MYGDYPVSNDFPLSDFAMLIEYVDNADKPGGSDAQPRRNEHMEVGIDPDHLPYFSHNEEFLANNPELLEDAQYFNLTLHRASKPADSASLVPRLIRDLITFFNVLPAELTKGAWQQTVFWMGKLGGSRRGVSVHASDTSSPPLVPT